MKAVRAAIAAEQTKGIKMTEKEKLLREFGTLKDSIKNDWSDLASKNLTSKDRGDIRQHIDWCINEMKALLDRLKT